MRARDVVLVQMELATHEGKWYLQLTYYDREGNEARIDHAIADWLGKGVAWNAILSRDLLEIVLDLAGSAEER